MTIITIDYSNIYPYESETISLEEDFIINVLKTYNNKLNLVLCCYFLDIDSLCSMDKFVQKFKKIQLETFAIHSFRLNIYEKSSLDVLDQKLFFSTCYINQEELEINLDTEKREAIIVIKNLNETRCFSKYKEIMNFILRKC